MDDGPLFEASAPIYFDRPTVKQDGVPVTIFYSNQKRWERTIDLWASASNTVFQHHIINDIFSTACIRAELTAALVRHIEVTRRSLDAAAAHKQVLDQLDDRGWVAALKGAVVYWALTTTAELENAPGHGEALVGFVIKGTFIGEAGVLEAGDAVFVGGTDFDRKVDFFSPQADGGDRPLVLLMVLSDPALLKRSVAIETQRGTREPVQPPRTTIFKDAGLSQGRELLKQPGDGDDSEVRQLIAEAGFDHRRSGQEHGVPDPGQSCGLTPYQCSMRL